MSSVIMFQDSLIANLLRLIQKMKPKPKSEDKEVKVSKDMSDLEIKKKLFPGLALPNEVRSVSPVSIIYYNIFEFFQIYSKGVSE